MKKKKKMENENKPVTIHYTIENDYIIEFKIECTTKKGCIFFLSNFKTNKQKIKEKQ